MPSALEILFIVCQSKFGLPSPIRFETGGHKRFFSKPIYRFYFLEASGSFPRSQFLASGDQSIGISASASVLPKNIQN